MIQGALLGFMGLVLAFGLSLALGRYEDRRAAVVDDANTIGTTYLRAQTLAGAHAQPVVAPARQVHRRRAGHSPTTYQAAMPPTRPSLRDRRSRTSSGRLAGRAVTKDPTATAPRLYEDSLNSMIDQQTVRVAGLNNRVPTEVLLLEVIGSAGAMFLVGLHVGLLGRSLTPAPAGSRTGHVPALRHLRPRSPDPRLHQGPRRSVGGAAYVHERAARLRPAIANLGHRWCQQRIALTCCPVAREAILACMPTRPLGGRQGGSHWVRREPEGSRIAPAERHRRAARRSRRSWER